MNRRDFLKMLGLAALTHVLPKLPLSKAKPAPTNAVAKLKTHPFQGHIPISDAQLGDVSTVSYDDIFRALRCDSIDLRGFPTNLQIPDVADALSSYRRRYGRDPARFIITRGQNDFLVCDRWPRGGEYYDSARDCTEEQLTTLLGIPVVSGPGPLNKGELLLG